MHSYTEAQKTRIRGMIEAFEGCREHLRYNVKVHRGICSSLRDWCDYDYDRRFRATLDATQLITRAIPWRPYLEHWQGVEPRSVPFETRLANRHAWLDKLIADCKAAL